MERHYYYKTKEGKGYLDVKSPIDDDSLIEITEEEFAEDTAIPERTESEIRNDETMARIEALKGELRSTDYIACKLAECETDAERAEMRSNYSAQLSRRAEIRAEINRLEGTLS